MPQETCSHLLLDYFCYIAGGWPPEHPECLLAEGHSGDHLIRFSDGRYFIWCREVDCECSPEEMENGECECFTYEEVAVHEAEQLIKEKGPR